MVACGGRSGDGAGGHASRAGGSRVRRRGRLRLLKTHRVAGLGSVLGKNRV